MAPCCWCHSLVSACGERIGISLRTLQALAAPVDR
jgi:hypothetical protein